MLVWINDARITVAWTRAAGIRVAGKGWLR